LTPSKIIKTLLVFYPQESASIKYLILTIMLLVETNWTSDFHIASYDDSQKALGLYYKKNDLTSVKPFPL